MTDKNIKLTQEERIAMIRSIVLDVESRGLKPNAEGQELLTDIQEEQATEKLVVNHGLLNAQKEDVEDEALFLETDKNVDFDSDENEVDMETISPLMREVSKG